MAEVNLNNNVDTQMIREPEVIMTMDSNGRSAPMAACLMVARNRNVIPRGARITEAPSQTLINTLAGTYAPFGTVTLEGLRLPSFDKNNTIQYNTT